MASATASLSQLLWVSMFPIRSKLETGAEETTSVQLVPTTVDEAAVSDTPCAVRLVMIRYFGRSFTVEIVWRRARSGDSEEAAALSKLMVRFYEEDLGVAMNADTARRTLATLEAHPESGALYVAEDVSQGAVDAIAGSGPGPNSLAGYALVMRYLSNEFGGFIGFLDEFYLLPPYQGHGAGTRFLDGLDAMAHGQDFTALWLEVDPDNPGAQSLYRRHGFVPSERVLMRKVLPANPDKPLPDVIDFGLSILFVGYNPGLRSAELGHHFAGHSNRFWDLLNRAGLTPRKFSPLEDRALLTLGLGVTNLVDRPTRAASELTLQEYETGRHALKRRIELFRPAVVAYFGKDVYRRYAKTNDEIEWGRQSSSLTPGIVDFVVPNPSGLNRMPIATQLSYYRELAQLSRIVPVP